MTVTKRNDISLVANQLSVIVEGRGLCYLSELHYTN